MRTLALAALLISSSALACPDLSGTFAVCRSLVTNSTDMYDMTLSQSVSNGVTTYTMKSQDLMGNTIEETYKADGKTVTVTETDLDTGMLISLSTRASCQGTRALNIDMNLTFAGENAAKLNVVISKIGNKVTMVTTGTEMGETANDTVICE
jgi:hypothetical protein